MYEINKIQFALEAFKEKLEEDKLKWSSLWESLEENPSFEEVYDITNKATSLAKSEKEEIDRLESHLVSLQSYHKKLQSRHSEVTKHREELLEQYESLMNEEENGVGLLKVESCDNDNGFSGEILESEDTAPARHSIAFMIDLNPPASKPVEIEVPKKTVPKSTESKSFLDDTNQVVDSSVVTNDISCDFNKNGNSLVEQDDEPCVEGDSMLSNTFLNEMEELKSNLALDSSQSSINAQGSSVCYNSCKEPVRVDPETPKTPQSIQKENEKSSCEVKKKSTSLISKFIKKSRSLSRSRKDKKKKPD